MFFFGSEDGVEQFFTQHRRSHRGFENWVEWYADYGNVPFYLVYAGILVTGLIRRRREALCFGLSYIAGLLCTLFITEVAKDLVGRPRPPVDGDFMPLTFQDNDDYESFPSGHMTETVYTVSPLAHIVRIPGTLMAFGLFPVVMGMARIYLGRHHPTDLIGGMVLGSLCAFVMASLYQLLVNIHQRFTSASQCNA